MKIKKFFGEAVQLASLARAIGKVDVEKDIYINERNELVLKKTGMEKMKRYLHFLPFNPNDIPVMAIFRPLRNGNISDADAAEHLDKIIQILNSLTEEDIEVDESNLMKIGLDVENKILSHSNALGVAEETYGRGWLRGSDSNTPKGFLSDVRAGALYLIGEIHGFSIKGLASKI